MIVRIIGRDLAKHVFQVHGAAADGSVVFRRKMSRAQLLKVLRCQLPCGVAMEACASAHQAPITGAGQSAIWVTRSD